MNIASAKLLEDAAQSTSDNILKRRQMELAAQQAARQYAIESQLRDIQEQRYLAQGQHYSQIEANQAEANKIHEQNQQKMLQQADNKYNLTQHLADLESTSKGLQTSMGQLAQDVVAGKMSPQDASAYLQDSWSSLSPDMQRQMTAQNPKLRAAIDGNVDWPTIAQNYQATLSANKGGGRSISDAFQSAVQAAQKAKTIINDPQSTPDQIQDATQEYQQQTERINTLNRLYPTEVRSTTSQRDNPIPGLPPIKATSATTTSRTPAGTPAVAPAPAAAPVGPTASPQTTNQFWGPPASLATPPPAPAAPVAPPSSPNPQVPPVAPSAAVAPATTVPSAPIAPPQAHIDMLLAHPEWAPYFDQHYGQGAAASYLPKQSNQQQGQQAQ